LWKYTKMPKAGGIERLPCLKVDNTLTKGGA
jgi:hypothetical protein